MSSSALDLVPPHWSVHEGSLGSNEEVPRSWDRSSIEVHPLFVRSGGRVVCKALDVLALSPLNRNDDHDEDHGPDDDHEEDDAYEGAGALVSCFSNCVRTIPD